MQQKLVPISLSIIVRPSIISIEKQIMRKLSG